MKHFIYKTTHKNGKYYIGRHSTDNINDGYIGSGRWPRTIKNKQNVIREILEFADSLEELIEKEEVHLKEHFGKPNCMNMSNKSSGAATGSANPMKNSEIRVKISGENHWLNKALNARDKLSGENHWMNKNPELKENFIKNNPNLDGRNAKIAMERGTHANITKNPSVINSLNGTHHWQNGNSPNYGGRLNRQLVAEGRHNWLGPEANQKRIDAGTHNFLGPDSNKRMLEQGIHPSQQKVKCQYCEKITSRGMWARWHGERCKQR